MYAVCSWHSWRSGFAEFGSGREDYVVTLTLLRACADANAVRMNLSVVYRKCNARSAT